MTGCKNDTSAKKVVSNYLNSYTNYTKDVENELDKIVNNDLDLSSDAKKMYRKIMKKQYKDLEYTILSEEYDDDKALVTVRIKVYNLLEAENEVTQYLSKNLKDFYNERNEFDNEKYVLYKLNYLYNYDKKINFNIVFFLNYKDKEWSLVQPTDSDLEKLHGIYKET